MSMIMLVVVMVKMLSLMVVMMVMLMTMVTQVSCSPNFQAALACSSCAFSTPGKQMLKDITFQMRFLIFITSAASKGAGTSFGSFAGLMRGAWKKEFLLN